jgi:DNA-binding NarL/FixJ family response regulator
VLVVDDHPLFRQGLRSLVEDSDDLELAGEAHEGEQAVRLTHESQPDVVVMDISMPGVGGVEATRRILRERPGTAVLIVTMIEEDDAVFAAIRAGARGYVLKGAEPEEIRRAISTVARGEALFGPSIAERLVHYFEATDTPQLQPFSELTPRERDVLDLLARGRANPAIAAQLGLTEKTVRNNVSNILTKLRVPDRAAAVARARDAGIGKPQ